MEKIVNLKISIEKFGILFLFFFLTHFCLSVTQLSLYYCDVSALYHTSSCELYTNLF